MSLSKSSSSSMPATPAIKNNNNKTIASPRSSMQAARATGQWTLTSDQAFELANDKSNVSLVLLPYLPLLQKSFDQLSTAGLFHRRKEMKLLLLRNRIAASPWSIKLSSQQPHQGPKSPLDIPEILEQILILLDERTIRSTTRFVCKLWFVVSRRLALWEVCWDDTRDPFAGLDLVLARLPRAGALSWGASESKRSWKKLEKVLKGMANQQGGKQHCSEKLEDIDSSSEVISAIQQQQDPLAVPLRQLRFHGKGNYIEYLDTILPSLWALTSLSLTFVNKFEVNPVLEACPNLKRLHLEGYNHPSELTEIQVCASKGALPVMTYLKTLALRDVYIPIPTLELLLRAATTTLIELKLVRLVTRIGPLTFGNTAADVEHTSKLIQFFSNLDTTSLLPHLRSLHVSPKTNSISQRHSVFGALIKPGPSNISEWGFCLDDASPFLFTRLQTVGRVVTTLDLTHGVTPNNNDLVHLRLHTFLCNAPALVHLKAPRVHIAPLDLCLFGSDATPTVDTRRLWTCRHLETLQIGLYHRPDTAPEANEPQRARVVFGYLSRVLPKLRVLELNLSSTNLQLETGFCLLARMQGLEQLRVVLMGSVFYWSKKPDLDWMADTRTVSRCLRAKWNWQQGRATARWKGEIDAELEVVKARKRQLLVASLLATEQSVSETLREDAQWETQGLLTDVKQVLDEIKSGKLKCPWPKLCNFRIYVARSAEDGLEEMIQAVRPGIDMSDNCEHVSSF
ncbi:MAG: hypothetical protein BYD32DRAFT_467377 [Podila humilis]|nr:MAG: hypothetical protein BYD32DRAFT_467377 [Podila humilis]